MPAYDATEQSVVVKVFAEMLWAVTRDGGKKRAAGTKPPWWRDNTHEAALFSHLNKWKHGEKADNDSGAHPLVHLAWRALSLAYQETYGQVNPACLSRDIWTPQAGAPGKKLPLEKAVARGPLGPPPKVNPLPPSAMEAVAWWAGVCKANLADLNPAIFVPEAKHYIPALLRALSERGEQIALLKQQLDAEARGQG